MPLLSIVQSLTAVAIASSGSRSESHASIAPKRYSLRIIVKSAPQQAAHGGRGFWWVRRSSSASRIPLRRSHSIGERVCTDARVARGRGTQKH